MADPGGYFIVFQIFASLINQFAAACQPGAGGGMLGIPTWYKYLGGDSSDGKCVPIFTIPDDIGAVLLAVFEIILRVGALVAVGFIIYGGFQFILAQGEPDRIKGARSTIINSLIGLIITILATAVVNLIANNIITT